jgi:hypothetical protein
LIVLGYGFTTLLWLQLEDNHVLPVTLLGLAGVTLLGIFWALSKFGGSALPLRIVVLGVMLLGALIGVGTALATALLMLFKTGMHAHLFPDYPPGLMIATLQRAPLWGLAGALAGLGLALLWLATR